jgi:hypothetical protein
VGERGPGAAGAPAYGIKTTPEQESVMNRHERRAAHKLGVYKVTFGRYFTNPDAKDMSCYVCGAQASPWPFEKRGPHGEKESRGLADITFNDTTQRVAICQKCFGNDNALMCKFLGVASLELKEAGQWDPAWDRPQ